MAKDKAVVRDWLPIIESEYREMPGLNLTKPQISRLWGLDPTTCDAVVEQLEADRVLRAMSGGRYVLTDGAIAAGKIDEGARPDADVPACATF